ncbi:tyrosine-type recombinase/integrase [Streptococcus suis]|nr:tyrosine-type recombinase/integrase [Streptococcus suis]
MTYSQLILEIKSIVKKWFFLSDRKSDSYALQRKHINLKQQEIQLVQALDRYKTPKSTKGNKKTTFGIPTELTDLLIAWKKQQKKEMTHATPHKLRHTGATLAKQAGTSLEAISEALTHSDTITTKTYVNTSNVVPLSAGTLAYQHIQNK